MNAPDFKTLADPMFAPIFNKGESTMNAETTTSNCQTGEERPLTSVINQPCGELPHNPTQTIQGVSGASYAPMDTSPQAQTGLDPIAILDDMMARFQISMRLMVTALQKQTDPQTDLEEAVSTTLENAQWFKDRVEENCAEAITDHDFDYEIGQNIERYMRNSFDANDHYDFDAEVRSRVEDEIESIIDGLVEEAVEARLADLLEEKLANAKITINF